MWQNSIIMWVPEHSCIKLHRHTHMPRCKIFHFFNIDTAWYCTADSHFPCIRISSAPSTWPVHVLWLEAGRQAFHPSCANHNWLVRATVDGSLVTDSKPSFDNRPSWGAETRHPKLVVKYPHWLSLPEIGHNEHHGLKCWLFLDHTVCRQTVLQRID